jgi:hypothetical protein
MMFRLSNATLVEQSTVTVFVVVVIFISPLYTR